MRTNRLQRSYVLRGLDRVLYDHAPSWSEGTFEQKHEDCGRLILHVDNVFSEDALNAAKEDTDSTAARFRLAIAKRTGCPLTIALESSDEPNVDSPGVLRAQSTLGISGQVSCVVLPRHPPAAIEQIPQEADRWVLTITETKHFEEHVDEVVKRLYLLVEELQDNHRDQLAVEQRAALREIKWVRDFVSHPVCKNEELCRFFASQLPTSLISIDPIKVRFDRTNVDHRNFVGRYHPQINGIAHALLDAAIRALR